MLFGVTSCVEMRVEFDDIDLMGHVNNQRYVTYLERARIHGFKSTGTSFSEFLKSGFGLVIAEFHLKYLSPLFFEQDFWVYSRVVAARKSSMKVFQAISTQKYSEDVLNKVQDNLLELPGLSFFGQARIVCVSMETQKALAMPDEFRKQMLIPDEDYLNSNPEKKNVSLFEIKN